MLNNENIKKEIITKLSLEYENHFFSENLTKIVENYVNIALKDYYVITQLEENFKYFFINIACHQCNPTVHPLTCGINSSHQLLVPRFDYGGKPYLVCPTCYSIQETMPMLY